MALALAAGAAVGAATALPARVAAQPTRPPNVVVVMTDDQTVESMKAMPQVRSLIGDEGATFTNNFVNYSLCCPSRSTFQTGQYAHNHGVESGHGFLLFDPSNALPVWLHAAGYRTALVGKYLNGYGDPPLADPNFVPPGWDEWDALLPNDQAVYDYDLNENGSIVHYGSDPADFKGDVLTAKALDFIQNTPPSEPFFLDLAYTAPHTSTADPPCPNAAKPAPQDVGTFAGEPLPQPPSFNEADVSDKPQAIQNQPPLSATAISRMTDHYRCTLESLQYVDRGVAQIVDALNRAGRLDSTLIIFTSDNGFLSGEHRIPGGKVWPYEESIRVPLLIRGPGVPAGTTVDAFATNADLASTILDATGVQPGLVQDGESLYKLLSNPGPNRDILIENGPSSKAHPAFEGVRTDRYLYVEYATGERELYDLASDPYELSNVVGDPAYAPVVGWLARRLEELRTCRGRSCRDPAGQPPSPVGGAAGPRRRSPDSGAAAPAGTPSSPGPRAASGAAGGTVAPFTGQVGFRAPSAVAASAANGDLYVADTNSNRIEEITAGLALVRKWGARGSGQGQFIAPRGVATAPGGDVYVADSSNDRVQQFTADGTFVRDWGSLGSDAGQFDSPEGIAVAADGDVYVADGGNDRIEEFASDGTFINAWGTSGTGDGELASPGGLAVAPSGDVYVTDRGNDRVEEFTSDGAFVRQWGGYGTGDGQFSYPRGIAVDPAGDVYVADTVNTRVQEFAADGTFIRQWGTRGVAGGEFFNPRGLAIGSNGDVYVADSLNNRLQRFTADGQFVAAWGAQGDPLLGGIATASNGDVYVSDVNDGRIVEFAQDGSEIGGWGTAGRQRGQLRRPHGVAIGANGDVYVADTGNNRIEKFKADGTYLRRWGGAGAGPGQLNLPEGVAIAPTGDVYVADTDNNRIQEFTSIGAFVREWPTTGPLSVTAAPSGDLYVTGRDDTVREFTADGTLVRQWGDPSLFAPPASVTVASNGDVYVANPAHDEIDQFTATGEPIDVTADPLLTAPTVVAATGQLGTILATSGGTAVVRVTDTTPNLTGTIPASPSSSQNPSVLGVADPTSTVSLYSTPDCAGPPLASGLGSDLSAGGIAVSVPLDQTTQIRGAAMDAVGNVSGCSSPIAYTEDSTPPETTIDSGPPSVGSDPNPSFTFSSSEPASSFRCRLDALSYRPCASPKTYSGLADGAHVFRVRAVDQAGNIDPTPAQSAFTVATGP